MSNHGIDVYGGNYPKARRLALARSSGKCQFCGLRKAVEAHHWAFPVYPSGEKVQGHDLTALCKTCHELATVMRDWVARKDASVADLAYDLDKCNTFIAKREVFSYWLYPEEDEDSKAQTFNYDRVRPKKGNASSAGCLLLSIAVPVCLALLTWLGNLTNYGERP